LSESATDIYDMLFKKPPYINIYCTMCKEKETFTINTAIYKMSIGNGNKKECDEILLIEDEGKKIKVQENKFFSWDNQENIEVQHLSWQHYLIEYTFSCTNCAYRMYFMSVLLEFDYEGKYIIQKICQYPMKTEIFKNDLINYPKQVANINGYEDYLNSLDCEAKNLYAGACTYLRRVLEKMLKKYCAGNTEIAKKTTTEQIKELGDCFDPDIKDKLVQVYKLLSEGIHNLKESEIKKYYTALKKYIDLQLKFEYEKEEKEKTIKEYGALVDEGAIKHITKRGSGN